MDRQHSHYIILSAVILFVTTFLVYSFCVFPSVGWKDSGEFTIFSYLLGVAHAAGYPLMMLLGKLSTMVPFGEIAYRSNLLSAFFGALTIVMFFLIFWRIWLFTNNHESIINGQWRLILCIGGLLSLCLAFSRSLWRFSTTAEAYSLLTFFLLLFVYLFILFWQTSDYKILFLLSFLMAIGLGNHITTILYYPVFFILLFIKLIKEKRFKLWPLMGTAAGFFILGLGIYWYLPIRAGNDAVLNWGNPDNLGRFLAHITGRQYATRTFSLPPEMLGLRAFKLAQEIVTEVPGLLILMAVFGFTRKNISKYWILIALLAGIALINAGFFLKTREWVGHLFLPTYLMIYLFIGLGLVNLMRINYQLPITNYKFAGEARPCPKSFILKNLSRTAVYLILMLFLLVGLAGQLSSNHFFFYQRHNWLPALVARQVLTEVPYRTAIVIENGNTGNALAYLQWAERCREDCVMIDPYGSLYSQALARGFIGLRHVWWANQEAKILGRTPYIPFRPNLLAIIESQPDITWFGDKTFVLKSGINVAQTIPYTFVNQILPADQTISETQQELAKQFLATENFLANLVNYRLMLEQQTQESILALLNNNNLYYFYKGLVRLPVRSWQRILYLQPDNREALMNLAIYYEGKNLADKAETCWHKLLKYYPDDDMVQLQYGIYLVRHQRPKQAIKHFRLASRINKYETTALYNLAVLEWKEGRIEQARKVLKTLLYIDPHHTKAQQLASQILIVP